MKRFLFEIGFSFVLITMGAMMSFFELSEFETVNGIDDVFETNVLDATATKNDPFYIDVDEDITIHFEYDDAMKDDIEITISDAYSYSMKNQKLKVDDMRFQFFYGKRYIDTFIDGLKDDKLYYFNHTKGNDVHTLVIKCKKDNRSNIIIND